MRRKYKIFWIVLLVLIPVFPLSGLFYGVDVSDVGLSINMYRFFFEDITSVYLPILLSELMGGTWLAICGLLRIPPYLGVEIAWVLACYYMAFLSCRIYRRYRNDALVLPALALALLLAKCNFHYFIYATGVAVMSLTALYFLIVALNQRSPVRLAVSVFFLVMACLCKISSLVQFAVYAVLFYDLYKKRDKRYFVRQILCCVLGFLAGLAAALILIQATCGLSVYGNMIVEMFLYAGNSEDGHSLGSMIMSNVNGALRGALLLALLFLVHLFAKKVPKSRKVLAWAVPIGIVLLIVGKLAGLDELPGLSLVYGELSSYLNALAVVVALVYICAVMILRDKSYPEEFRTLVLCAGLLTVLLPIGSNTGIQHMCNEISFALPYIAVYIGDQVRKTGYFPPQKDESGIRRWIPPVGLLLTAVALVWCVGIVTYQSLYMTRAYHTAEGEVKAFELDELKGMRYEAHEVDELEEITAYLRQYEGGERKLLVAGSAPILNFLSGIPPFTEWCGGWIETEFISYEKMESQLAQADICPIVVLRETKLDLEYPKVQMMLEFMEAHAYEEVFATEEYVVYLPEGKY